MATSSTEIANWALGHIATGKSIANLDTENSAEANACRRYYDLALNCLAEDFEYPFQTVQVALGLIQEDPNDEYKYEYQYPSDCQRAGHIKTTFITDNPQSQAHYRIMRGDNGRVIWTNCQDAMLEYQIFQDDVGRFSANYGMALSYKLAELIAPTSTGGDPFNLGARAKSNYELYITKVQSNSLSEEQDEEPPAAEWLRVREGNISDGNDYDWIAYPINFKVS